jgi:D-arabinose 1-dehydrogenase-like Zn-dependent alcohol dehydrogenase
MDGMLQSEQIVAFGQPLARRCYEIPKPEGTEVLVRITASGLCHSDLHVQDGFFDLGGGKKIAFGAALTLPLTPGHEIAGEVIAIGPEAEGVAVGDRRIVYPWIGCGRCRWCKKGDELMCGDRRSLGIRADGGFADHVVIPHPRYLVPHDGLTDLQACTLACSGVTALSALRKLPPLAADDALLIVGAGGVGLAGIGFAPSITEARLVVADINPEKRKAALAAGAAHALDSADPAVKDQIKALAPEGFAAAIDFVGSEGSVAFALGNLRRGGTLVMVGLYGGTLPLGLPQIPSKMLTIRGSFVGTLDEMREAARLLAKKPDSGVPVSTRPLSQANAAIEDLRAGKVVGRIVLVP